MLKSLSGNITFNCTASFMMICILFCLLQYSLNLHLANEASIQMEDGLASACLAGLDIDMERYSQTYLSSNVDIVVRDAIDSYELFKDTLYSNVKEQEDGLINNIRVENYIVYNVFFDNTDNTGKIDISYFDNNTKIREERKNLNEVYSPNGIKISKTSVYADVRFDLKLLGLKKENCHRQLLTNAYKK